MIRSAMILAAGRGERMRPLTDSTPKPLIPVGGRSTLDRAMDRLQEHHVRNLVINVHHLGEQIAAHVGAGRAHIVREESLLDTGGSVKNALPLLGHEPFFVLNGDGLWTDGTVPMLKRLEAAWDPKRMDALLLLHPIDKAIGREASDKGDYFVDDVGAKQVGKARHRGAEPTAPYFFASVSICDSRIFRISPDGPFSLVQLWHRAQAAGHLYGLVHDGQWFHVGTPHALAEAEQVLA
jgi:MurNAc alpha-1-phosphate uridylyltransferase